MPLEGTSRFPDTRNQRMALNHETRFGRKGTQGARHPTKCVFLGKEGA